MRNPPRRRFLATIAVAALAGGMSLTSGLMAAAEDGAPGATASTTAYKRFDNAAGSLYYAERWVEVGSLVQFAEDADRDLDSIAFELANWGCEVGYGRYGSECTTSDPEGTFDLDITVNLYEVAGTAEAPLPGALLDTSEQTVPIKFRPSADPVLCPNPEGGDWSGAEDYWDATEQRCRADIRQTVTFDAFEGLSGNAELPDRVFIGVEYHNNFNANTDPRANVNLVVENSATTAPAAGSDEMTFYRTSAGGFADIAAFAPSLKPYRPQLEVTTSGAPDVADTAAFSRVPKTLAPNYVSLGFQAYQIHEFGAVASLADGPSRDLTEIEVVMSSWACETGAWQDGNCASTPGATYVHPVTVRLYEVAGTAEAPAPGDLIASRTVQADVPFRPSASEQCAGGRWRDEVTGICSNGYAFPLVFDNFGDVDLPDDVLVTVRSDSANVTGTAGPYDALNVAIELNQGENAVAPRVGSEPSVDNLIRWSSTGPNKGVPLIWADYAEYSPMIEIRTALDADATLTAPATVLAQQDVTPVVAVTGAGIPVDGTVTVAAFVGEGAATCSGDPAEIIEVDVADLATADLAFSTALPGTMGFAAVVDTFRGDNVTTTDCATTEVRAFFTDAGGDHPFFQQIQWLGVTGLSTGYADGTYRPAAPVSRQATAAFLARWLEGDALATCAEGPFTDVPADHGFCKEIQWMETEGLSLGYEDGSFQPAATVTRQAGAAFLARAIGGELPACTEAPFPDVPTDHAFCPQIQWMKAEGVASGYADGTFGPTLPMTRQAMAAWVHAANGLLPD